MQVWLYTQTHTCTHMHTHKQDTALWACLAGMATSARDLNTAEIAYAAINEVYIMLCDTYPSV